LETVALLAGLAIGAAAVWSAERYHERKRDQLFSAIGQMQMQIEGMRQRIAQLEEPPIPEEEL
jgi:hypothetical protein